MCIKDYLLAIALQLIEPALWKTKAEDNAKYDGTGDFFSTRLEDSCVDYAGAFKMLRQLPQEIHILREEAIPEIAASDIAFMKQFFED